MDSKKEQYTANSIANKIDEIHMKLGLPLPKRVTGTGYTVTIGVKPLGVSDKKNK